MIVGDGRPLRFLALVGGGWTALRIALLWHATGSLPAAVRGIVPLPMRAIAAIPVQSASPLVRNPSVRHLAGQSASTPGAGMSQAFAWSARSTRGDPAGTRTASDPARVQLALLAMTQVAGVLPDDRRAAPGMAAQSKPFRVLASPLARVAQPSALTVSSWMIARGGTGIGATALSPQLGGTQGGVRVDYALTRGIAATTRIAAPAAGAGRELSFGIAWRPAGVPIRLVAEQRIALDHGRGGPALGLSGGVSELPLPVGFRLEGYGQAGAIIRRGIERYVDGSARAARPLADVVGIMLDVGGGAWGGAQRGVARLDVGPSIGARVPLAGQTVRVSLDWRHRIAGNARPGSGPALSLGSDF